MLALLGLIVGTASGRAEEEGTKPLHLFLLAGQSNMAGRGEMSPERREPIEGVYALQADGSWGPAVDPIHWDKQVAGVGLARSFARAYLVANPGVTVGFIPAACGGSSVDVWQPGAFFEPIQSHPYDDAIERVRLVRDRGQLQGILWHQGEADSHPGRSDRYERRLRELFDRFRSDLNAPNLPILVGQLGEFSDRPWTSHRREVDAAHRRVAAGDGQIKLVSAQGLTAKPDLVHFDAASLDELGRRYAEAWAELITEP